ncbi:MAG: D-2-hydroxyacid dehydrogenase family protein [Streptosporangiales bacterium]|nr:D-2-hydroxyacid dehydrogenase family protein [Streptosporangiales bacterium]
MRLRCAVLDDYQDVALSMADWSVVTDRVDVTTFRRRFEREDDLVDALRDCEVVVIMRERTPFPETLFARLPKLKLLVTTGMRNASVDLAAAAAHGVTVCGTAGSSEPTVELTWALILGVARHVVTENNSLRSNGQWQSTVGVDLAGKTLGLLGFGRIGTRVGRIGRAFGMDVVAWSRNLPGERTEPEGVRLAASKEELLAASDFVSIHLVLSGRTRGLVDAAALAHMRPTAYLVNTSRGPIVDQRALVEALDQRKIAGAALDVFDVEPLPDDDPLRAMPNVLATPHLGYVTQGNYTTYYREVVEDIEAYLAGSPIRTLT